VKLTKHTKRFVVLAICAFGGAALYDAIARSTVFAREWPSLLSVCVGVLWLWAGIDDFRLGAHKKIADLVVGESQTHPVGWYRRFLLVFVKPRARVFGYTIPASMLLVGAAYLSGVAVLAAAVGALFLLANMMLFLRMLRPRDDFIVLLATQVVILATGPSGIPGIIRAA
jgi:hypothetical protein